MGREHQHPLAQGLQALLVLKPDDRAQKLVREPAPARIDVTVYDQSSLDLACFILLLDPLMLGNVLGNLVSVVLTSERTLTLSLLRAQGHQVLECNAEC